MLEFCYQFVIESKMKKLYHCESELFVDHLDLTRYTLEYMKVDSKYKT